MHYRLTNFNFFLVIWCVTKHVADGCHRYLSEDEGIFTSPDYPSDYGYDITCVYLIDVTEGKRISLEFTFFEVQSGNWEGCIFDRVWVYDGGDTNSPVLGTFCGSDLPSVPTSTGDKMLIVLITDDLITRTGFRAKYRAIEFLDSSCHTNLTEDEGIFTSPDYPSNYANYISCTYLIEATEGKRISLEFTDFNVENGPNCTYDRVKVYDGGSRSSPVFGTYCGTDLPTVPTSTGDKLLIELITDVTNTMTGFRAKYRAVDYSESCDLVFTDNEGKFTSPGHPFNYPTLITCTYLIHVSGALKISLEFGNVAVDFEANCIYDSVTIYNGKDTNSPVYGTLCGFGTLPPQILTGNELLVKFVSDSTRTRPGFTAKYSVIDHLENCNLVLTTDEGNFTSPGHPSDYPTIITCTYFIRVSDDQTISLEFDTFDVEEEANCTYDSVTIYDGDGTNSPSLGNYCGTDSPPSVVSTGETLLIVFVSDYTVTKRGFTARYKTIWRNVCPDPTSMVNLISTAPDSTLSASSGVKNRTEVNSRMPCKVLSQTCYHCGWSASYDRPGEYIQVDLGDVYRIKWISTAGSNNFFYECHLNYVESFKLLYSLQGQDDFKEVTYYTDGNNIFQGNDNGHDSVDHDLISPFWARYVRLVLVAWHDWPALRWELSGCKISDSLAGVTLEGVWGDWSDWGPCSTTCGPGYEFKTRLCQHPTDGNERVVCVGHETQPRPCNILPCPIHGGWNVWQDWGNCSVTCDSGQQTRIRTCTSPAPQHGGDDCVGEASQTKACTMVECPIPAALYPRTELTVFGANDWGEWMNWVYCPPGSFVDSFRIQTHKQGTGGPAAGNDDTALNSIILRCERTSGNYWEGRTEIKANDGIFGDWTYYRLCPINSYIHAFELRSEAKQSAFKDDTSANVFNAICKNAWTGARTKLEGQASTHWGEWLASNECPPGGFVSGIRTRFESFQGMQFEDDTALNDVQLVCLPYPY